MVAMVEAQQAAGSDSGSLSAVVNADDVEKTRPDRLALSTHSLCLPPGEHPFDCVRDPSVYSDLAAYPEWRARLAELDMELWENGERDIARLSTIAQRLRSIRCNSHIGSRGSHGMRGLLWATKSAELHVRVDDAFVCRWGLHDLRELLSKVSSRTNRRCLMRKYKSGKSWPPTNPTRDPDHLRAESRRVPQS